MRAPDINRIDPINRAHVRLGGLAEAVDALLDKGTRLGIWAPRKAIHMALHK